MGATLGRGGYGRVFAARVRSTGEEVAIKAIDKMLIRAQRLSEVRLFFFFPPTRLCFFSWVPFLGAGDPDHGLTAVEM